MELTSKMKKIIIGGLAGSALLIAGGIYAYQHVGYSLSAAEAQEIAFENAGVSPSDITFKEVDRDREDGKATYDIDFTTADGDYSYTIDAQTGSILDRDFDENGFATKSSTNTSQSSDKASLASQSATTTAPVTPKVSENQAKEIVLKDAGLAETAVSNLTVKLDEDDGQVHYDVDFDDMGQKLDYDYQIDAATGAILEKSSETLDNNQEVPILKKQEQTRLTCLADPRLVSDYFPNPILIFIENKKESGTEIGNFEEIRFRQQVFISSC